MGNQPLVFRYSTTNESSSTFPTVVQSQYRNGIERLKNVWGNPSNKRSVFIFKLNLVAYSEREILSYNFKISLSLRQRYRKMCIFLWKHGCLFSYCLLWTHISLLFATIEIKFELNESTCSVLYLKSRQQRPKWLYANQVGYWLHGIARGGIEDVRRM